MLPKGIRDKIDRFDIELMRIMDPEKYSGRHAVWANLIKEISSLYDLIPGIPGLTRKIELPVKTTATSYFFYRQTEFIQGGSEWMIKPSKLHINKYAFDRFLLNVHDELIDPEVLDINQFEQEQREINYTAARREQKSKAWSAEVRKKVKALRPVGPQVYCQTEDDD